MKHTKFKIYTLSIVFFIALSCEKKSAEPLNTAGKLPVNEHLIDSLQAQYSTLNEAIYYVCKDWYLWNELVPAVDYNSYSDPQKLIDALKYSEDRWSFIADKAETNALFGSGETKGQGLDFGYDQIAEKIRISFTYNASPAGKAGMYRGMIVNKINGKNFVESIKDNSYIDELSKSTITYEIIDTAGIVKNYTIANGDVKITTVLYQTIKNVGSKKVGYLVFNSFLGTSEAELTNAFAYFKSQNIDELILDLRYNGGGYVYISEYLGHIIVGNKYKDKIFNIEKFNSNHSRYNDTIKFGALAKKKSTTAPTLDLGRVFIIASKSTASASELLINGLKPYMTVIQIGDVTHGKPVGFFPFTFRDTQIFPVSFESTNANGVGGYYDGITPNVYKNDGLKYVFGDVREDCLKEALYYIENNSPSPIGPVRVEFNEIGVKLKVKNGLDAISGIH